MTTFTQTLPVVRDFPEKNFGFTVVDEPKMMAGGGLAWPGWQGVVWRVHSPCRACALRWSRWQPVQRVRLRSAQDGEQLKQQAPLGVVAGGMQRRIERP